MNLRPAVLGLLLVLAGCAGSEPSNQPSPAGAARVPSSVSTPTAEPIATAQAGRQGVVAYARCPGGRDCSPWIVNADGTDRHALFPGGPGRSEWPLGWSADGTRLYDYFQYYGLNPGDGGHGLAVTDAAGSPPRVLFDTGDPSGSWSNWCPMPFKDDNCSRTEDRPAPSPDGTRFAWVIAEGRDLEVSTIVVLDVASGRLTRLKSTRTLNPRVATHDDSGGACTADNGGYNSVPQWSPDGTTLAFIRLGCHSAIYSVRADDSALRELAPLDGEWDGGVLPRWSPDGSSIVFSAQAFTLDDEGFPVLEATTVAVYTVRADGTGIRALTSDGQSLLPSWTRDGRIVFVRLAPPSVVRGDLWVMNADGGHATRLPATIAALTAAGCVVCPYPITEDPDPHGPNEFLGDWNLTLNQPLWQPVQEDQ